MVIFGNMADACQPKQWGTQKIGRKQRAMYREPLKRASGIRGRMNVSNIGWIKSTQNGRHELFFINISPSNPTYKPSFGVLIIEVGSFLNVSKRSDVFSRKSISISNVTTLRRSCVFGIGNRSSTRKYYNEDHLPGDW